MIGNQKWAPLGFSILCLAWLSACDVGSPSRFDDMAGVDVCSLVSPAEASQILGSIVNTTPTSQQASGMAGVCTWTFKPSNIESEGAFYVSMLTRASSPHGPRPARYLDISKPELEASLGASAWPMENLGDSAFLYQTQRPDHSELWMLQSQTLVMFGMMGGSAAQMERFARAVSRELSSTH